MMDISIQRLSTLSYLLIWPLHGGQYLGEQVLHATVSTRLGIGTAAEPPARQDVTFMSLLKT